MHIEFEEERPCVLMTYYHYWLSLIVIVLVSSFLNLAFKKTHFKHYSLRLEIYVYNLLNKHDHDLMEEKTLKSSTRKSAQTI